MSRRGKQEAVRPWTSPYWKGLLLVGALAGVAGAGLLSVYVSHTDGSGVHDHPGLLLFLGIIASAVAQVLLGAGIIGFGVASAGFGPALNILAEVAARRQWPGTPEPTSDA